MNCYVWAHTHFWQLFLLKNIQATSWKNVKNVYILYPEEVDRKLEYKLPFVWYFWSTVAWIKKKSQILKHNGLFSINLVYSSDKLFLVLWLFNTVTSNHFAEESFLKLVKPSWPKKQNYLNRCLQDEKYTGFRPDAILQHLQFWYPQKLPIKEEIFRQFLDKTFSLPPPLLPLPYSPPWSFIFRSIFFLYNIILHMYIWAVEVWMC